MRLLLFFVFAFSIIFASWYVYHGDIEFSSDIARDFHILREISEKKIILIGPRASGDLFHGVGWPYLNYIPFVLGKGNPLAVGWWWVALSAFSGTSSYFVGKKLFDKKTGYLFGSMMVLYTAFHAKGMINPHGVMILLPMFFYSFIKYFQTSKPKFLIFNIVITGLMVQMELMAIPLAFLSFIAILVKQMKEKRFQHIPLLLIFAILVLNFLVFDLRHDFLLIHRFFNFASPAKAPIFGYYNFLTNRIDLAFGEVEILRQNIGITNLILFLTTLVLTFIQVRNNKYKLIYLSFFYFYFGYYVLSLLNRGQVLYFHEFPVFPLVFLAFSSIITTKYSKAFLVIFLSVLVLNLNSAIFDINQSKGLIGRSKYSWKFLNEASRKVFEGQENEFGYFVYSPDVTAYEPKYAMIYNAERSDKKSYYFQKKPITYLLIQPPPPNDPFMTEEFWIKTQLGIKSPPVQTVKFDNGYKVQKYLLTDEEIKIPFDPAIDPRLHFR